MVINGELKKVWLERYSSAPETLKNIGKVKTVAAAFNTCIDAVIKVKPAKLLQLIEKEDMSLANLRDINESKLKTSADVLKGLFRCFEKGIAEEWISEEITVYDWMSANLGYDRLQMGGQAGIVSNALAVTGVKKVYAHCNSLPKMQADVFVKRKNLVSFDASGKEAPAYMIDRVTDIPLIHWIIEFDKNDKIEIEGEAIVCPKSNRFIATYDPLNLRLVMDKNFVEKMAKKKLSAVILSGYHALTSNNRGVELIEESIPVVEMWKKDGAVMHLELASTQDIKVRRAIIEKLAPIATSVGTNERETIDVLEVIGEKDLALKIEEETSGVNLFQGLIKMKQKLGSARIQLHMFGLYMAVQDKDFKVKPEKTLAGMAMAATAAASKASIGNINLKKNLLTAHGKEVSDVGLNELRAIAAFIGDEKILTEGIAEYKGYDIIILPTILVEKPITLVGMGDTISSLSLISSL